MVNGVADMTSDGGNETFRLRLLPQQSAGVTGRARIGLGNNPVIEIVVADDSVEDFAPNVSPGPRRLNIYWPDPPVSLVGFHLHYTSSTRVADDAATSGSDPSAGWVAASLSDPQTHSHTIWNLTDGLAYRVRLRHYEDNETPSDRVYGSGTPATGTSWKGYALALSVDREPSERGEDVTVTLDLGQPAPPNFFAILEGLPAGTAAHSLNSNAPDSKRLDLEGVASDWTMLGKVQLVGGNLGLERQPDLSVGVVAARGGWKLQTHLRDWNGAQMKTVRLRIFDDTRADPNETIVLRATGYNFGSPTVLRNPGETFGTPNYPWPNLGYGFGELHSNTLTLTIADDESGASEAQPLQVGVLNASTYESGDGEPNDAPITIWLSRPAEHDVTLNYATAPNAAKPGVDYTAVYGTVTIPAGETRAEVIVPILDDAVEDSGETFRLRLSNPSPSSVRLARSEATITIRNDELRLADLTAHGGPGASGPWSELDIGEFSPDTTDYAVTVPYQTTHARLRATPMERAALATRAGDVNPGGSGRSVALEVGDNTLVMVASGSAGDVKTYRVTVTREVWAPSSNADLRWLLVQGASNGAGPWTKLDLGPFDPDTTEYAVTAPLGTTVARVLATPEYDANGEYRATLRTGVGTELKAARPGFWSQGYALAAGDNAFGVEATAEDGTTKTYTVTVTLPTNEAPTVASGIANATIVSESGARQVSLAGVFSDPDGDALAITAASSDTAVATVSVAADYSTLTVSAQARGTATITVTAADGYGGSVEDTFTVTVKAAPVVASAIADISGLEAEDSRTISMSGVFSDPDGDAVTVTQASSSDISIAAVSAAIDGATAAITAVTVTAGSEGTATITVTARDSDGNTVQDAFDVTVNAPAAQQQANNPPTVASAIADATIVSESGTHRDSSVRGVRATPTATT